VVAHGGVGGAERGGIGVRQGEEREREAVYGGWGLCVEKTRVRWVGLEERRMNAGIDCDGDSKQCRHVGLWVR
jgi:hypothetical protein